MLHNFAMAVRELQRTYGEAFNAYRPELHYMRGPGPACRAKHPDNAIAAAPARVASALARAGLAKARV